MANDFFTKKVNDIGKKKYPRTNSVSSLNRVISYKSGVVDGILLMKGWAKYYEENKFRIYTANEISEEQLFENYIDSIEL